MRRATACGGLYQVLPEGLGTLVTIRPVRYEPAQGSDDVAHRHDGPLAPEWLDHPLNGEWKGHRECHVGGDFLLAYKLDDSAKHGLIVFVRAGTHADLFE